MCTRKNILIALLVITVNTGFATSETCSVEENGRLHLISSGSNNEGILKICLETFISSQIYKWWTLCNVGWSPEEVRVVCGQLGYMSGTGYPVTAHVDQGALYPDYMVHNITYQCTGTESALTSCVPTECAGSSLLEIVGVQCQGDRSSNEGSEASVQTASPISPTLDVTPTAQSSSTVYHDQTNASSDSAQLTLIPTFTELSASTTIHGQTQITTQSLSNTKLQSPPTLGPSTQSYSQAFTPGTSPTGGGRRLATPVAYALAICSAIAVLLFVIIVTLVAIIIKLAKTTGGQKKHQRVQESDGLQTTPEDTEHYLENQLYTDSNFLSIPRDPCSHNFNRNGYESVEDREPPTEEPELSHTVSQRRARALLGIPHTETEEERTREPFEDIEYSRLNVDEVDYATLEPHINHSPTRHRTDDDDYSHLIH